MKVSGIQILSVLFLAFILSGCSDKVKPQNKYAASSYDSTAVSETEEAEEMEIPVEGLDTSFQLPELLMPGQLDVPPLDVTDSTAQGPLLAVANIGRFASVRELRKSYFYKQFCSLYPELVNINRIAVDTGVGDLWLFKPLVPNCSMAINEYNMKMFMQEVDESDGKVYFRTEIARPILVKASMDDPGSIIVNMVDGDGRQLHWIPTQSPSDNELRPDDGVANLTYNVLENYVEMGADYTAPVNGGLASLRFYADRQVRVDNRLMRYRSFHSADGDVGLYIKGMNFEAYFKIGGNKKDKESFTLTSKQGYDFGMGSNKTITFKK